MGVEEEEDSQRNTAPNKDCNSASCRLATSRNRLEMRGRNNRSTSCSNTAVRNVKKVDEEECNGNSTAVL